MAFYLLGVLEMFLFHVMKCPCKMRNVVTLIFFFVSILEIYPQEKSPLYDLTNRFTTELNRSFDEDTDHIVPMLQNIEAYDEKESSHWKEYWTAYAKYQQAVYWAYNPEINDEDKAADLTDEAIAILEGIENKNIEDWSLLGYLKGFSIQWLSFIKIPKESIKAYEYVITAVEKDPQNPRANMVYGNNNFHLPGMFGGGKEVVEYMSKAISLYKMETQDPNLPTWGMPEAYQMLTRHYVKKDMMDEAKSTLREGLERFPNAMNLNRLREQVLEDKKA